MNIPITKYNTYKIYILKIMKEISYEEKNADCGDKRGNETHVGKQSSFTWRFVCFAIRLQKWLIGNRTITTKFKIKFKIITN